MAKFTLTRETFPKYLKDTIKQDGTIANRIQKMLEYAFEQYLGDGHNATPFTEIVSVKWRSVRSQAIQDYVEGHTDLSLVKADDGQMRFKRNADKVAAGVENVMPEVAWDVFSKAGQATPIEPDKKLKGFISSLDAALKGKGKKAIAEGEEEEARNLLAHLKAYVPLTPDQIAELQASAQA